jgi:hypothetical protein
LSWVRAPELLPMINTIYVVSRLEEDDEREAVAGPIRKIAPNLNLHFLGRHDYEAISSTQIRKNPLAT